MNISLTLVILVGIICYLFGRLKREEAAYKELREINHDLVNTALNEMDKVTKRAEEKKDEQPI